MLISDWSSDVCSSDLILQENESRDGTRKWVFKADAGAVETVFIPDGRRGTLCVSSQVGCAMDCSFCSTGKQGFQRDLTSAEIIGQVWQAAKSFGPRENLGEHPITKDRKSTRLNSSH